jgi:hypothetical protein
MSVAVAGLPIANAPHEVLKACSRSVGRASPPAMSTAIKRPGGPKIFLAGRTGIVLKAISDQGGIRPASAAVST